MSRILKPVLFVVILTVNTTLRAQLIAKENSIPKQSQLITTAQDTPKRIKELSIGSRVPDIQFKMANYSRPIANLSDFKGKLVIIDFWASWCYSCLLSWPQLTRLQEKFADKVQFIMVNSKQTTADDEKKVVQVVKKYSNKSPLKFLVSYDDNVALALFPHHSLPHYIWITPNGLVKAITAGEEVNEKNISMLLENENSELTWAIKKDYMPNKLMDLAVDGQPDVDDNLEYFSVFKKGRIDGLGYVNTPRSVLSKDEQDLVARGISMRNVTIIEMFETALRLKRGIRDYTQKLLVLNVKDSSRLLFDSTKTNRDSWEKENYYTYDLILPASQNGNMPDQLWSDINKFSGFKGKIERVSKRCLVLQETKKMKPSPNYENLMPTSGISDGKFYIQNVSTPMLAKMLDQCWEIKFPVIDKTGLGNLRVSIEFDAKNPDIDKIRHQLASFGLDLKETNQMIDVLVISENSK
jgi:thiol-disulfide isomerase/thioredoxin